MSRRLRQHPNRGGLVLLRGGLDARSAREDADWAEFASRIGWQSEAPILADEYEENLAARIFENIGSELHSAPGFDAMEMVAATASVEALRSASMVPVRRRVSVGKTVALALTIASVAAAAALSARASLVSSHDAFVTREADVARQPEVVTEPRSVDSPKSHAPDPQDAPRRSQDLLDQPKPKAPLPEAHKAPEPHPGLIVARQDSEIEMARHLTVDDISHRWADMKSGPSIALTARAPGASTFQERSTVQEHSTLREHASFVPAVAFSSSVSMVPRVSVASPVSLSSSPGASSANPSNTLSSTRVQAIRSDRVATWAVPSVGQRWVGVSAAPPADGLPGSVSVMAQIDFARALRL